MKQKILTSIIIGMIFLIGIVTAANTLSNLDETMNIPLNVVAGDTFTADFSFDYYDNLENTDNSPLIIKLNLTSENTAYPVWRGDFEISGFIEKTAIFGLWTKTVPFSCSEAETQTIVNPIDTTTINNVSEGTFYCYDAEGDLKLNEHDEVFLNITSHPALYPSQYTLMAEMFYLNDTTNPFVLILNKNDFNKYYRELNNIEVRANITDGRGINGAWGVIITPAQNISLEKGDPDGTVYPFTKTLPNNILEGNYELRITAKDFSENVGSDSTILMIDRTVPNIEAIQPHGSYDEIIYIELNVTDEKSGVDDSSVKYRISEMIPDYGYCPEGGYGLGNLTCYDSGWLLTTYNPITEHYHDEFNSSVLPEGEYWFEAKAEDILGNEGKL